MKLTKHGALWEYLTILPQNRYDLRDADVYPLTTCDLHWMFIKATGLWVLLVSLLFLALGGLSVVVADTLAWLVAMTLFGWIEPHAPAGAALLLAVASVLYWGCRLIFSIPRVIMKTESGQLYHSWKNKYCSRVEIVHDEN